MIRSALILGLGLLVAGCATSEAETTPWQPAQLTDASNADLREALRLHVREQLGPDYIINPDELVRSPQLVATDRGRSTAMGETRLIPDVMFRLEVAKRDGTWRCRLVQTESDAVVPLLLSDPSICDAVDPA